MAKSYLYAVQDDTGRELCSVKLEPEKLGDVTAKCNEEKDSVQIFLRDAVVATGSVPGYAEELHLHRWPITDKLANPVSKRVC
jgi:hypothetical protein